MDLRVDICLLIIYSPAFPYLDWLQVDIRILTWLSWLRCSTTCLQILSSGLTNRSTPSLHAFSFLNYAHRISLSPCFQIFIGDSNHSVRILFTINLCSMSWYTHSDFHRKHRKIKFFYKKKCKVHTVRNFAYKINFHDTGQSKWSR